MREETCKVCGVSLEAGSVTWAEDGSTFDELGLSEQSAAIALAATEHLLVRCVACGAAGQIGVGILRLPQPVGTARQTPWDARAVELYRSLIAVRLRNGVCAGCGSSLEHAAVARATGGAGLSEHSLGDEALARLLASTQRLWVHCSRCGYEAEI